MRHLGQSVLARVRDGLARSLVGGTKVGQGRDGDAIQPLAIYEDHCDGVEGIHVLRSEVFRYDDDAIGAVAARLGRGAALRDGARAATAVAEPGVAVDAIVARGRRDRFAASAHSSTGSATVTGRGKWGSGPEPVHGR